MLAKHPFLQIKLDLQARGICRDISLHLLEPRDIDAYMALEFPGHSFPPELGAFIYARTEGSPLFMVDLLRYLRDQKVIAQEQDQWLLKRTVPNFEREMPESVRSMVQRKTDQLSDADHTLVVVAAVQGYEFDSAVVAKVLGMAPGDIEERLEALDRIHSLVRFVSEREFVHCTLSLRYRFVHVLYQNALYGSLTPTRRAYLSGEVGRGFRHGRLKRRSGTSIRLAQGQGGATG